MYRIRTAGYSKRDPIKRWALPDRVFFACGACHILAYAFLDRYSTAGASALRLTAKAGERVQASHIVVATATWIFDYHGFCERERYLGHTIATAQRWWPDCEMEVTTLPTDVLISEAKSRAYDGLWLREPQQFLHDALPRARAFLDRFPPSCLGGRFSAG